MIHQQPPPKPPLLPQHMILSPHKNFPGHGDRLGRRSPLRRRSRAPWARIWVILCGGRETGSNLHPASAVAPAQAPGPLSYARSEPNGRRKTHSAPRLRPALPQYEQISARSRPGASERGPAPAPSEHPRSGSPLSPGLGSPQGASAAPGPGWPAPCCMYCWSSASPPSWRRWAGFGPATCWA